MGKTHPVVYIDKRKKEARKDHQKGRKVIK